MATIKMTRKALYDLIWEKPMSAFIKDYNISYPEAKQLFEKYNIPVPVNGYWSKLRVGQKLERIPLPVQSEFGEDIEHEPRPIKKRGINLGVKAELPRTNSQAVPDREVLKARKIYMELAKGRERNVLIKIAFKAVNINVSPLLLDRALSFIDALIKAVRDNGGDIRVEPSSTFLRMDGEDFFVALREKQNRIERKQEGYSFSFHDFVGSGILVFKVGEQSWCSREWSDTSFVPIEDKIDAIIEYLQLAAVREKERREERRIRKIEEEKARLIKEDMEKRRKGELDRFIKLKQCAERWESADRMRRYLDEMERLAISKGCDKETEDYIIWARGKLDWYDPLKELKDEIMDEVDRNSLTVIKKWGW